MRKNGANQHREENPDTKPTFRVENSPKKSYTKSTLTIYGTIRDLTKMVASTSQSDGGGSGMTKTQLP
jgi:hypothetical protein